MKRFLFSFIRILQFTGLVLSQRSQVTKYTKQFLITVGSLLNNSLHSGIYVLHLKGKTEYHKVVKCIIH